MRKIFSLAIAALAATATPAIADTISNTPDGGAISPFGAQATPTYGEVFTAPISGTLSSFTMSLNGAVGAIYGAVGTWNGGSTYGSGYGSPTTLYQSGNVASTGAQSFTFSPDVAVVAGQQYVAYLSTYGVGDAFGATTMGTASPAADIDYFVFNNDGDARNNASWDYFANFSDVQLSATFVPAVSAAPEPGTWMMMILGFGLVGGVLRSAYRKSEERFTNRVRTIAAA